MAFGLKLTRYTGATLAETVDLHDLTSAMVLSYNRRAVTPEVGEVSESARVRLIGGLAAVLTKIRAIELMFEAARKRGELLAGDQVFIECKVSETDGYFRAELADGLLNLASDALDQVVSGTAEVTLSWTRENGWDGVEAQIPLTNGNGTNNTSGLTVYAWDDEVTGRDNWVDIAAASVAGDLPAKTRIELVNTYSSALWTYPVRIWHSWRNIITAPNHVLEGEHYVRPINGAVSILPASPSTSAYSHGQYITQGTTTVGDVGIGWDLSSSLLAQLGGNFFKVMLLPTAAVTDMRMRIRITHDSGTPVVYDGPWASMDLQTGKYFEVATLRLPPALCNAGVTLYPLELHLLHKRPSGATTIGLDHLMLMPMDGHRRLEMGSLGIGYNSTVTDDGITQLAHISDTSGSLGYCVGYGEQIRLQPGKAQRLYFIAGGGNFADRTSQIKVYYRPRRMTL